MRLNREKAQVSIEFLIIMGIILLGVAMIFPSYLQNNTSIAAVSFVKSSAQKACDYLNTGVYSSEYPYSILNPLIASRVPMLSVDRVILNETTNKVTVFLTTPYSRVASSLNNVTIAEFIVSDVVLNSGAVKVGPYSFKLGENIYTISVRVVT